MSIMILLRLLHILAGATWVGAMVFTVTFLFPVLREDPAVAGKVQQGLMRRRYLQFMPGIALVTILSGLWMIWVTSGGHLGMYNQTPAGHTFTMAGGLAIVAFLIGMFVARPAAMKAGKLGAQMASVTDPGERAKLQEQIAALQKKNILFLTIVTWMLLVVAAGMAIARYV